MEAMLIVPTTAQGTSTIQTPRSVTKAKTSVQGTVEDNGSGRALQQGKTYPFHLSFQNPLYEPIQVRMMIQRPPANTSSASANTARTKRPPFAVSLPTSNFPIAPYAEAWEYDEDEEDGELDDDDIEDMLAGRPNEHDKASPSRVDTGKGAPSGIGVIERKANITKVGGEVVIGRDGTGPVKVCKLFDHPVLSLIIGLAIFVAQFNLLVTYTYRADDSPDDTTANSRKAPTKITTKTFSFYVCVDLGTITSS